MGESSRKKGRLRLGTALWAEAAPLGLDPPIADRLHIVLLHGAKIQPAEGSGVEWCVFGVDCRRVCAAPWFLGRSRCRGSLLLSKPTFKSSGSTACHTK